MDAPVRGATMQGGAGDDGNWRPRWDWEAACAFLRGVDPDLEPALRIPLPPRPDRPPFGQLVRSICAQQVSVASADAVEHRLAETCGGTIGAEALAGLDDTALRAAGLSRPKVGYLRALIEAERAGRLVSSVLEAADEEELVARLTALPGIGRWSVEMLLIFGLHRPDVLPADDLGVQAAMGALLLGGERPSPAAVRARGRLWLPHRSAATLALWAWRRAGSGREAGRVES